MSGVDTVGELHVLGVDLGSRSWATNGSASLSFRRDAEGARWTAGSIGVVSWPSAPMTAELMAEALDRHARDQKVLAVSLDGPQAWRDPSIARKLRAGRLCERESRTPGKTGPWGRTYPQNYYGWVSFCIEVFERLLAKPGVVLVDDPTITSLPDPRDGGYYLIECFPTNTWRSSGLTPLPGHSKAPPPVVSHFAQALITAFGLPSTVATSGHDDLQAVVAALPAAGLLGGPCEARPRGTASRLLPSCASVPGHRVEGLIWSACPLGTGTKTAGN